MKKEFSISTSERVQFVNIDNEVERIVSESGVDDGFCVVYVPHTTAAVTINENADPDVIRDMIMETSKIVPFSDGYRHAEGNSAAHIKASFFGSSELVNIYNGRLVFGTWQSLFFCEFDGPRTRKVIVQVVKNN